jgi:hypothetical protein
MSLARSTPAVRITWDFYALIAKDGELDSIH